MPVGVVVEDGLAAAAGDGGITGLEHEGRDDSVGGRGGKGLVYDSIGLLGRKCWGDAIPVEEVAVKVASTG